MINFLPISLYVCHFYFWSIYRYPHRPAGVSSHNSSQLRSPITSEGYSGDKNRTGISPDTTTKDDQQHQIRNNSQNSYLQQNQNLHHNNMLPSPHHSNSLQQQQNQMRSPQQAHSGGGMGRPPNLPVAGVGRMPPQQQHNNPAASFLAYSAGDVPSTVQNRNQQQQHLNQSANLSQHHGNNSQNLQKISTNQAMGESNSYSNYNSNMSLLNASSSSSKTPSSVLDPSRNATTQDRYKGKLLLEWNERIVCLCRLFSIAYNNHQLFLFWFR